MRMEADERAAGVEEVRRLELALSGEGDREAADPGNRGWPGDREGEVVRWVRRRGACQHCRDQDDNCREGERGPAHVCASFEGLALDAQPCRTRLHMCNPPSRAAATASAPVAVAG